MCEWPTSDQAKRLKLVDSYEKLETKVKDKGKEMMSKGNTMLHRWEEKSKEFIGNFVEMFGATVRIMPLIVLSSLWILDRFLSI